MAKDRFPIDDPNDEIPAANRSRRLVVTLVGLGLMLAIIAFIVWFAAENGNPPDEQPSIFGHIPTVAEFVAT